MYAHRDARVNLSQPDPSRLSAEERLLLLAARTWLSGAALADAARLLGGPIDGARLIGLAEGQAVLPLVARMLATRLRDAAPPALLVPLDTAGRASTARALSLSGALLELLAAFDRAGIPVLPFKGPVLAIQAYRDPGLRSFADLDLLVRPETLPGARDLLLRLDFEPSYPVTSRRRALLVRHGSHETLERGPVTVELHWRVASSVSEFSLDYDRLWSRLGTVRIGNRLVPALRPDDLLLLLVLHGTKHAWERLAWICDVAELLRAAPSLDWDALRVEAARMRCERPLGLALLLADTLLGGPVPEEIRASLGADPALSWLAAHVRSHLFLPPRSGAGTFGFHLRTRTRLREKIGLALGSLTALNQRDLEAVALPDAALPLYFLTRPARLAGKALAYAARGRPR